MKVNAEAQKRFAMADKIREYDAAILAKAHAKPIPAKPTPALVELTPQQQRQRDAVMARSYSKKAGQPTKPEPVFNWQHAGNSLDPVLNGNWLVKKFLPAEGLAVMYGRPGCGKSFIGTDIALHIATGMAWRGHKTKQCQVSYVASEGGLSGVNRIHAWIGASGKAWPEGFRLTGVSLDLRSTPADAEALIADVKANQKDCGLVIIDTLNRNFGGGSENEDDAMGAFVGHCDRISKALQCLLLVVHH